MQNPPRTETNADDRASAALRHIGLLLFDGVEELDAVGPWEVLAYWTQHHPEDGWAVSCLSADGARRHRRQGPGPGRPPLAATTPRPWTSSSTRAATAPGGCSATPTTWTGCARQRAAVPLMASVCTGSLVYAAAGLLRAGRRPRTGRR